MMETPDETHPDLRTEERLMIEAAGRNPSAARVRMLLEEDNDWDAFKEMLIKNGAYLHVAHTLMGQGKRIPPAVFEGFKLTYVVHEAYDRRIMFEARELARQFAKEGIEVVFLKGNHDPKRVGSKLYLQRLGHGSHQRRQLHGDWHNQ